MEVTLPKETRSTTIRLFNGEGCPTEYILDAVKEEQGIVAVPKSFFERGTLGHSLIESKLNADGMEDFIWEEYFASDIHDGREWMETSKCTQAGLAVEVEDILETWEIQYDDLYSDLNIVATELMLEFETPKGTVVRTEVDALFDDGDGNPIVVDWKLGTSKSGKDMQLYIYWYGLRRAGHVPMDAEYQGWFHYVNYTNPIGLTMSDTYPGDAFIEDYIDTSEYTRKMGRFLPNPSWMSCRYCANQSMCPIKTDNQPDVAWESIRKIEVTFA